MIAAGRIPWTDRTRNREVGRLGPKMRRSNLAYGVSGPNGGGRRWGEREMRPR